jgi:hypothetical protein
LQWKRADGEYRNIKVNCTAQPDTFNHYNINFIQLSITFQSLEPFWYKEIYQVTNVTNKAINFTETVVNE